MREKHLLKKNLPQSKLRTILKYGLISFCIVFISCALAAYGYLKFVERRLYSDRAALGRAEKVMSEPLPDKPINVLLLGSDARGKEWARADVIILMHLDPARKKAFLISIPRDMRVEIPERGFNKINAAHSYGGPELMIRTVENFTGFPIHHYVETDFRGFQKMADALGGVEIYVDKPIVDKSKAYKMNIAAGYQRLDGQMALNYVRYRHGDPKGDFGRIERQQKFLKALMKKVFRVRSVLKFPILINIFADNTSTDLSTSEMLQLVNLYRSFEEEDVEMVTLPGEAKMIRRVSYVIPDEKGIKEILSCVKESRSLQKMEGKDKTSYTCKDVKVEILNGCGTSGLASKVKEKLVSKGFKVVSVGNADNFQHKKSVILYRPGQSKKAKILQQCVPSASLKSSEKVDKSVDVELIIGKDYKL